MDNRLDASTKNIAAVDNLANPVVTYSALEVMLKKLLEQYRSKGSYAYQAAAWAKVPYVRSAEEIELEALRAQFKKHQPEDSLTLDDKVKLAKFAYKNPKDMLCKQVASLFHEINGTGRHYDILKLYIEKNLLTPDSLSFLLASTPELRWSLHQFITEWNSNTTPLTLEIVEYAESMMLSVPVITSQQAILLFQELQHDKNLTLEKISTLTSRYHKQLATLTASLEIVMNYNKAHINRPTDINFAFLYERLENGQLSSDTAESLTLLANNQLLTKNIVSHHGTPALLQQLRDAQRLQEETLSKLQKHDEPVVITPPPPPPPLPTFKITPTALILNKKSGGSDKKFTNKAAPFLDELQERIKHLAKAESMQKSSVNHAGHLSVEEILRKEMEKRNKGLQGPKEEPLTEESREQPELGW